MKELVEKKLGYKISDVQYDFSSDMASKKLDNIIKRFGDGGGVRKEPEYLAQLIAENVKASLLSQASILIFINVLNMEKEHSANAGAPLVSGRIV